jgi:hypothetical protein
MSVPQRQHSLLCKPGVSSIQRIHIETGNHLVAAGTKLAQERLYQLADY